MDLQKTSVFQRALESIKYEIVSNKTENFTNGDDVKIKASFNETLINDAKIKVTNTEFTYTVSGLKEAEPLDLFDEIEVVFEDVSPNITARVFNRSERQFVRDIGYNIEPSRNLRIGDKLIITANVHDAVVENNGFILINEKTKEYIVENVDAYASDFSDIDQAARDLMKKESLDVVVSQSARAPGDIKEAIGISRFALNADRQLTFDEPELTNIYFLTRKPGVSSSIPYNASMYVYKITAYYESDSSPEPRTGYIAIRYKDAIKKADGSTEVDTTFDSWGTVFSTGSTFEAVYNDVVTAQRANYEIQEITP